MLKKLLFVAILLSSSVAIQPEAYAGAGGTWYIEMMGPPAPPGSNPPRSKVYMYEFADCGPLLLGPYDACELNEDAYGYYVNVMKCDAELLDGHNGMNMPCSVFEGTPVTVKWGAEE